MKRFRPYFFFGIDDSLALFFPSFYFQFFMFGGSVRACVRACVRVCMYFLLLLIRFGVGGLRVIL